MPKPDDMRDPALNRLDEEIEAFQAKRTRPASLLAGGESSAATTCRLAGRSDSGSDGRRCSGRSTHSLHAPQGAPPLTSTVGWPAVGGDVLEDIPDIPDISDIPDIPGIPLVGITVKVIIIRAKTDVTFRDNSNLYMADHNQFSSCVTSQTFTWQTTTNFLPAIVCNSL